MGKQRTGAVKLERSMRCVVEYRRKVCMNLQGWCAEKGKKKLTSQLTIQRKREDCLAWQKSKGQEQRY
jgi:hypothetical protein